MRIAEILYTNCVKKPTKIQTHQKLLSSSISVIMFKQIKSNIHNLEKAVPFPMHTHISNYFCTRNGLMSTQGISDVEEPQDFQAFRKSIL